MEIFDNWLENNRKQLEQDFIDDYEDMFIEYCKNKKSSLSVAKTN